MYYLASLFVVAIAVVVQGRTVTTTTYSYPRAVDPTIFNLAANATNATAPSTQIQGSFYFPAAVGTNGSIPVVILFAGRHAGCRQQISIPGLGLYPFDHGDVDDQGRCPDNQTIILSHRGFEYLGQDLAAHGYAVISIDPQTLNGLPPLPDDPYLDRARARLLFRTVEKMREWDADAQTSVDVLGIDIAGTLDFSNVGLMGHSRGGTGVRLAYNFLYPTPAFAADEAERFDWRERLGIEIRAVMEVAPFDLPDRGVLFNVTGVPWLLLAAGCEDDEMDYGYINMLPRQASQNPKPNHFIMVYGANHAFFNSEWHLVLDTCLGDQTATWDASVPTFPFFENTTGVTFSVPYVQEAPRQRAVARWALSTFMRSYVGREADASLARAFDPTTPLPIELVASGTEIGRANVNLARSRMLSSGSLVKDSISVVPPARAIQSLPERAQSAFKIFIEQSHNGTKRPPHMLTPPGQPLRFAELRDHYDAVAVVLSSAHSAIHIPIERGSADCSSTARQEVLGTGCQINVDVARRDNCYLAASGNVSSTARKTCAQPATLWVQVTAGSSASAKIGLKSRFNVEVGPNFDRSATDPNFDVGFLPIAWETISLPYPSPAEVDRVHEICVHISADEAGAWSVAPLSSALYIGPVRLV